MRALTVVDSRLFGNALKPSSHVVRVLAGKQGEGNASTNLPPLSDGTDTVKLLYIVGLAGSYHTVRVVAKRYWLPSENDTVFSIVKNSE